jgi:hypothetical protein
VDRAGAAVVLMAMDRPQPPEPDLSPEPSSLPETDERPPALELVLPILRLVRLLVVAVLLTGLAGVLAHWVRARMPHLFPLVQPFDFHEPLGVKRWLAAVLALLAALALFAVARLERGLGARLGLLWLLLALAFLAGSIAQVVPVVPWLHDLLVATGLGPRLEAIEGAPVLLGLAAAALVVFLPFLWRLPGRVSLRLLAGAALIGLAGPLLTPLQGHYADLLTWQMSLQWGLLSVLEEVIELSGVVLVIAAALHHFRMRVERRVTLRLSRRARSVQVRRPLPEARRHRRRRTDTAEEAGPG